MIRSSWMHTGTSRIGTTRPRTGGDIIIIGIRGLALAITGEILSIGRLFRTTAAGPIMVTIGAIPIMIMTTAQIESLIISNVILIVAPCWVKSPRESAWWARQVEAALHREQLKSAEEL